MSHLKNNWAILTSLYVIIYLLVATLASFKGFNIIATVLYILVVLTLLSMYARMMLPYLGRVWLRIYLPSSQTAAIYDSKRFNIDLGSMSKYPGDVDYAALTHAYDGPVLMMKEDDLSPNQHNIDSVYVKVKVSDVELTCVGAKRPVGYIFYGHTSLFIVSKAELLDAIITGRTSHIRPKGRWSLSVIIMHLAALFSSNKTINTLIRKTGH